MRNWEVSVCLKVGLYLLSTKSFLILVLQKFPVRLYPRSREYSDESVSSHFVAALIQEGSVERKCGSFFCGIPLLWMQWWLKESKFVFQYMVRSRWAWDLHSSPKCLSGEQQRFLVSEILTNEVCSRKRTTAFSVWPKLFSTLTACNCMEASKTIITRWERWWSAGCPVDSLARWGNACLWPADEGPNRVIFHAVEKCKIKFTQNWVREVKIDTETSQLFQNCQRFLKFKVADRYHLPEEFPNWWQNHGPQ